MIVLAIAVLSCGGQQPDRSGETVAQRPAVVIGKPEDGVRSVCDSTIRLGRDGGGEVIDSSSSRYIVYFTYGFRNSDVEVYLGSQRLVAAVLSAQPQADDLGAVLLVSKEGEATFWNNRSADDVTKIDSPRFDRDTLRIVLDTSKQLLLPIGGNDHVFVITNSSPCPYAEASNRRPIAG